MSKKRAEKARLTTTTPSNKTVSTARDPYRKGITRVIVLVLLTHEMCRIMDSNNRVLAISTRRMGTLKLAGTNSGHEGNKNKSKGKPLIFAKVESRLVDVPFIS